MDALIRVTRVIRAISWIALLLLFFIDLRRTAHQRPEVIFDSLAAEVSRGFARRLWRTAQVLDKLPVR